MTDVNGHLPPMTFLTKHEQHQLVGIMQRSAATSQRCRAIAQHGVILDEADQSAVHDALMDAADMLEIQEHWIRQVVFPSTTVQQRESAIERARQQGAQDADT